MVHAPSRQPHALMDRIKKKLSEMEKEGHIAKVTEPTDWVNSMVTVVKQDKVRICLDPKDLNRVIRREHYKIPTVEEVVASISDATVFSVLDAKSGFLQVKIDYESSLLTTFNTPIGSYRWLRLTFGIKSAPEIFQRIMDNMLQDIEGASAIMDDILITGRDITCHDKILNQVIAKATEWNLKLNFAKCQIRQPKVKYVGHLVTSTSLLPDEENIQAVKDMPRPQNKEDVRRFLGFLQYLSKFIEGLSEIDKPLRELTKKEVIFHWDRPQEESFKRLKELFTTAPVLTFYDVSKDVQIQCDASSYALGGVLLQDGQPVAYTSRAMTPTEMRYAQIEKEMLAILHSCKKFHHYIFGKRVEVHSYHKPLQAIFSKPLLKAPMRLQSMMLRLQAYDLDVCYKPGKEIPIGDTLSRSNLPDVEPDKPSSLVNMIEHMAVSKERYTEFQKCTANELNELHNIIQKGWPTNKQETPHSIREYWSIRDELSVMDGVIYKGMRIAVPPSMRSSMLAQIHGTHIGIVKCKQRAREALYWPCMNAIIERIVRNCPECNTYQNAQHAEQLHTTKLPDLPWSEVTSDLFEWEGSSFIVTVDYYSKFIEVDQLSDITSYSTIQAPKGHFSRHVIPETLRTDNGRQYVSAEFKAFCEDYNIEHRTSSPHHPQSNGEAERAVQTVKRLWRKCKDRRLALLDYRTTLLPSYGLSPAQLLMGRRPRNKLPTSRKLLQPNPLNQAEVQQRMISVKDKQAFYFNKIAGPNLAGLQPGDPVRMSPLPGTKQ